MTALAVDLAYRAQQRLLVTTCGLAQRLARRVLLGQREGFSRAELGELQQRWAALLERDLANVDAGIYPRALLFQLPLGTYARRLPALARDLPRVLRRLERGDWRELPRDVDLSEYPPYYRRTFHWQSDGYLSRRSAELYDVGVEFLFGGTADVMRRQALVPLVQRFRGVAAPRILDLGCGTGRTLAQLRRALPDARCIGMDLSPYYLSVARDVLAGPPDVELVPGNAESIPLADASVDAVVSVFMFHELPRNARRAVWREVARVLRPGGTFVVVDSVQREDARRIAYFVERFADEMHEPFYRDYLGDDLAAGLRDHGFVVDAVEPAYLAKIVTAHT
ncbi:MAG TPA: class I SAM-dependent methyltransferase [Nannocystaceae bacterium]|nr:class I SAM-dependent methyltransferase [Nannocystaceae bacterium]